MKKPNDTIFDRYLNMDKEALTELLYGVKHGSVQLTEEAQTALYEALKTRNTTVESLLNEHENNLRVEKANSELIRSKRSARARKTDIILGRVLGYIGIPSSIAIFYQSIVSKHIGGLVASLAFFGTAIWLAFFNKGD